MLVSLSISVKMLRLLTKPWFRSESSREGFIYPLITSGMTSPGLTQCILITQALIKMQVLIPVFPRLRLTFIAILG